MEFLIYVTLKTVPCDIFNSIAVFVREKGKLNENCDAAMLVNVLPFFKFLYCKVDAVSFIHFVYRCSLYRIWMIYKAVSVIE